MGGVKGGVTHTQVYTVRTSNMCIYLYTFMNLCIIHQIQYIYIYIYKSINEYLIYRNV